jgi:hypothetical protein
VAGLARLDKITHQSVNLASAITDRLTDAERAQLSQTLVLMRRLLD